MKLSLYLAAVLLLSIYSASARPAHNAVKHSISATLSPVINIPASSPALRVIQSPRPVAVPDEDLSENVLSHPSAIPSGLTDLVGNIKKEKPKMTSSVLKLAPSPIPINDTTEEQQKLGGALPPVSVLAPPTPATVLPSVPVLDTDSKSSVIDDLEIIPSSASVSEQKVPDVFNPESKSQSVNVLEGYPIVTTSLRAIVPTSLPTSVPTSLPTIVPTPASLVNVESATKIASAAAINYSSAASPLFNEFESAVDDLMGGKAITTDIAAAVQASSGLDVLDSVSKVSADKVVPTPIIMPVQPITAEPGLPTVPPQEPLAIQNGEKMDNAVTLPIPLSAVDLPYAPPKPTIVSVGPLPSLVLPAPPPSNNVELVQSMDRASVALEGLKEAVDKFINEHMQDGKTIDMYNIRQQDKQPNLVHTFIDFQSILEASKAAINRLPAKEVVTNEDLQRLIKEIHDLMMQTRQMEIEYFQGIAGIKTNSQQYASNILEQGDIEKALKMDNQQEMKLPLLKTDEFVKLVSQFVEEMQKFLEDFAKSFGEIHPELPTPSIPPVPEPTLPPLPVNPIAVPAPASVPAQEAPIPSPVMNAPADPVPPVQPLSSKSAISIESILSNDRIFTELDFVEFLGVGTTYAAVPTAMV